MKLYRSEARYQYLLKLLRMYNSSVSEIRRKNEVKNYPYP